MKNVVLILIGSVLLWSCTPKPAPEPEAAAEVKPQPVEFADAKYVEIGKQGLKDLAEGNVDAFLSSISDNAKFSWNAGDSLMGKAAIQAYWKDRRGKAIDTMTYVNDVWLAVKANEAPAKFLDTGVYLFGWFKVTATYASGGKMTQLIHQVYHFDATDKIDNITQFLDRVPINAAVAAKKKK